MNDNRPNTTDESLNARDRVKWTREFFETQGTPVSVVAHHPDRDDVIRIRIQATADEDRTDLSERLQSLVTDCSVLLAGGGSYDPPEAFHIDVLDTGGENAVRYTYDRDLAPEDLATASNAEIQELENALLATEEAI